MRKDQRRKDDLEIIYEDQWLIVADKPSGLLTMSTGKEGEDTAYSRIYDYAGKIFIVHRLDRDTSGVIVFAKDQDTKISLQENWNEAVQERKYTALIEGWVDEDEGWIQSWLYENKKSMKVHCFPFEKGDNPSKPPRKDWQFAATHCQTLKRVEINDLKYTFVEFELETGRKNQIRTHSHWIGHPIAGDRKYGASSNPIGRLALHAGTLSFIHPWTGKVMKFTSQLPRTMKHFL